MAISLYNRARKVYEVLKDLFKNNKKRLTEVLGTEFPKKFTEAGTTLKKRLAEIKQGIGTVDT
jgi:hypothetical protein